MGMLERKNTSSQFTVYSQASKPAEMSYWFEEKILNLAEHYKRHKRP